MSAGHIRPLSTNLTSSSHQTQRHIKTVSTPSHPAKHSSDKPALNNHFAALTSQSPHSSSSPTMSGKRANSVMAPGTSSYVRRPRRGSNSSSDASSPHGSQTGGITARAHPIGTQRALSKYAKSKRSTGGQMNGHSKRRNKSGSDDKGSRSTGQLKPQKSSSSSSSSNHKSNSPTFQFKIGMQVGIGLGECYLQLQKLENSVSKLSQAGTDTRTSLKTLIASHQKMTKHKGHLLEADEPATPSSTRSDKQVSFDAKAGEAGNENGSSSTSSKKKRSKSRQVGVRDRRSRNKGSTTSGGKNKSTDTESTDGETGGESSNGKKMMIQQKSMDDCIFMAKILDRCGREVTKRILGMNETVVNLQKSLEDLDESHSQASARHSASNIADRSELEECYKQIARLQGQLQVEQSQNKDKSLQIEKLRKIYAEKEDKLKSWESELVKREQTLDMDADAIMAQTEELKRESERLMTERQEVRKQKEHWQKLCEEQSQKTLEVSKRADDVDSKHERLLNLHATIVDERKKLHREKKKILKERKKMEKRTGRMVGGSGSPGGGGGSGSGVGGGGGGGGGGMSAVATGSGARMAQQYGHQLNPNDFMAAHKGSLAVPQGGYSRGGITGGGGYGGPRGGGGAGGGAGGWGGSDAGSQFETESDYAETIISEDMSDIQSVNSVDSDDLNQLQQQRQAMSRLEVPHDRPSY